MPEKVFSGIAENKKVLETLLSGCIINESTLTNLKGMFV